MSTSKLDAIRELLKTQSEKHVIQAVWAAYQLTEAEAVRIVKQAQGIDTTVKGYSDPFILATEWLCVEQEQANGIPITCAPELKANNYKAVNQELMCWDRFSFLESVGHYEQGRLVSYADKKIDFTADQTPESYSHQVFIDYTNENTNRA